MFLPGMVKLSLYFLQTKEYGLCQHTGIVKYLLSLKQTHFWSCLILNKSHYFFERFMISLSDRNVHLCVPKFNLKKQVKARENFENLLSMVLSHVLFYAV